MPNGLNPNIEDIDLDDYRFRNLALAAQVAEWGRLHPEELHDFSYFHRVDMPRVAGENSASK